VVFQVVTPRGVVVGYARFGAPCCLHSQGWSTSTTAQRNHELHLRILFRNLLRYKL